MRAKTIAQYCICKWLEANFQPGCLHIQFVGPAEAVIMDRNGDKASVVCDGEEVYLEDFRG